MHPKTLSSDSATLKKVTPNRICDKKTYFSVKTLKLTKITKKYMMFWVLTSRWAPTVEGIFCPNFACFCHFPQRVCTQRSNRFSGETTSLMPSRNTYNIGEKVRGFFKKSIFWDFWKQKKWAPSHLYITEKMFIRV